MPEDSKLNDDHSSPIDKRPSRRKGDSPETIRQFLELYRPGATNKRIALDLGLSDRVIKRLRLELGLPKRRADRGDDAMRLPGEWITFSLDLPIELYRRLGAHTSTRYRSKAHYVRALIQRDLI